MLIYSLFQFHWVSANTTIRQFTFACLLVSILFHKIFKFTNINRRYYATAHSLLQLNIEWHIPIGKIALLLHRLHQPTKHYSLDVLSYEISSDSTAEQHPSGLHLHPTKYTNSHSQITSKKLMRHKVCAHFHWHTPLHC